MLDCKSLGPGFKVAGGRLGSLVVVCWTANHSFLGSKKQEGGWLVCGSILGCQSLGPGFMEARGSLVSPMAAF